MKSTIDNTQQGERTGLPTSVESTNPPSNPNAIDAEQAEETNLDEVDTSREAEVEADPELGDEPNETVGDDEEEAEDEDLDEEGEDE